MKPDNDVVVLKAGIVRNYTKRTVPLCKKWLFFREKCHLFHKKWLFFHEKWLLSGEKRLQVGDKC